MNRTLPLVVALSMTVLPVLAATTPSHRGHGPTDDAAAIAVPPANALPSAPLAVAGVMPPPTLPETPSYVLMDATTGAIIAEKAPTLAWAPASLTKLMTAYLTYQAITRGKLTMDQTVPVSVAAWRTGGSRMFISPRTTVTVDQLLHGLIIDSGNDSAVALAQAVAGNRSTFVQMMNATARRLGLTGTNYTDVDGLPDPDLYTTAADVAKLSRAIIARYPEYLKISSQKQYTFDDITQHSWNPVLFRDPSVDGMKTGLTDKSGHCIDATALRNGRRLIAVVLGGPSWVASTNSVEALLDYGYSFYTNTRVLAQGKVIGTMSVPHFQRAKLPVTVTHDVVVTVPLKEAKHLTTAITYDPLPEAGIARGARVGTVVIAANGKTIATAPVVSTIADPPAGFFTRILRRIGTIA